MNRKKNEKWLDKEISQAIETERPQFDLEKWKRKYPEEAEMLSAGRCGISSAFTPFGRDIRRLIMNTRTCKIAAAAAAVLLVTIGGAVFSPLLRRDTWWQTSAWGQEVIRALEKVETLVYRERFEIVGGYGSIHVSGSWRRIYHARDRKRVDQYYGDTIVKSEWEEPDGKDLVRYFVSNEYECYSVTRENNKAYNRDPADMFRMFVGMYEKADRILGTETFENRECVGFDISAGKYGDNPDGRVSRIWFDVDTKLPVLIENHGLPLTNEPKSTSIIMDQFEYYIKVPGDTFTPEIPEGYINASTHEIQKAREIEQNLSVH